MLEQGNVAHAEAIARAAGTFFNARCDRVISRTKDGELLGGVIFTGYNRASINMHVAGFDPRWIDRDMLWFTFYYPFEQLGVRKVIGTIHSGNREAILFNRKLGFAEEARIKDVFQDGDLLVMSMYREDCRWLKRGHRGRRKE